MKIVLKNADFSNDNVGTISPTSALTFTTKTGNIETVGSGVYQNPGVSNGNMVAAQSIPDNTSGFAQIDVTSDMGLVCLGLDNSGTNNYADSGTTPFPPNWLAWVLVYGGTYGVRGIEFGNPIHDTHVTAIIGDKLRMRVTAAGNVFAERSSNNGISWSLLCAFTGVITGAAYIKAAFPIGALSKAVNPVGYGAV